MIIFIKVVSGDLLPDPISKSLAVRTGSLDTSKFLEIRTSRDLYIHF